MAIKEGISLNMVSTKFHQVHLEFSVTIRTLNDALLQAVKL